ncbi:MAG: XTP/dITP diphosphatase [Acidobacteria bacterium]|nr:MAG: XTP/dITP diphosphatase [Acidobacteriota bacterium]
MMELLIGTRNKGKILEISEKLSGLPIRVRNLSEFSGLEEPVENGKSFTENACLKARSYALQTGLWALADDSGLEVESLNGRPGVFSARYAGEKASDEENIRKLLHELKGIENRKARFVCVMALCDEKGNLKFLAEGVCSGMIANEPKGKNGFGYDPVFIPDGFENTFGELSAEIKQKISHRAEALKKIISFLSDFTAVLT